MERSDKNLTLLQKGALQKTFAFFVYAFIASSLAFLLDYIDKHTFLSLIERAYHEGLLEKETFPLLQQLISTRAGHVFVLYTLASYLRICCMADYPLGRTWKLVNTCDTQQGRRI